MSEASSLSQMSVSDEYEDLVFRKVMAIYIANESARISSEVEKANAEGETTVNSKTINRLFCFLLLSGCGTRRKCYVDVDGFKCICRIEFRVVY